MAKIAVLSIVIPPSPEGQAVVFYRVLSRFNEDDYYFIHSRPFPQNDHSVTSRFYLPAQCYSLPVEPTLKGWKYFGVRRVQSLIKLFLHIFIRKKNLINILKHEPETTAVIACSGDLSDIPAAFLASKILRLPFSAYIFNDFVFQWIGDYRVFAKSVSSFIFKYSGGIIGLNEFICEEYHQRYGVKTVLIHNPYDPEELKKVNHSQWPAENSRIKIIYTGSICHADADCFRNLIQAIDALQEYPLELHIFTSQTNEDLRSEEIQGEKVFIHSHVSYVESLEHQRMADLLFLSLAFNTPINEVIRNECQRAHLDFHPQLVYEKLADFLHTCMRRNPR